jgi:hypothetical protein
MSDTGFHMTYAEGLSGSPDNTQKSAVRKTGIRLCRLRFFSAHSGAVRRRNESSYVFRPWNESSYELQPWNESSYELRSWNESSYAFQPWNESELTSAQCPDIIFLSFLLQSFDDT